MENTFDFGADLVGPTDQFKLWPTDGEMVGLVDADFLPYQVAFTVDQLDILRAQQSVESGLYPTLRDTPEYNDAFQKMCAKLNGWLEFAECDAAILYLTKSDENFRVNVAFSRCYKGTRPKDKPVFFSELKQDLIDRLGAKCAIGEEADDLISIEANRRNSILRDSGVEIGSTVFYEFAGYKILSGDKDSRITTANHVDPVTRKKTKSGTLGALEPVWKEGKKKPLVDDLKGHGIKFFYAQLIMGDATDNYTGIPRKGCGAAFEALDGAKTEKECYEVVLSMYKDKYGDGEIIFNYRGTHDYYDKYKDAHGVPPPDFDKWKGRWLKLTPYQLMVEQGRLAHMQTVKGELWRPNCKLPDGGDYTQWNL